MILHRHRFVGKETMNLFEQRLDIQWWILTHRRAPPGVRSAGYSAGLWFIFTLLVSVMMTSQFPASLSCSVFAVFLAPLKRQMVIIVWWYSPLNKVLSMWMKLSSVTGVLVPVGLWWSVLQPQFWPRSGPENPALRPNRCCNRPENTAPVSRPELCCQTPASPPPPCPL